MSRAARRSRSTKVTCPAPRLSASMPTAPVPAYPSATRAPLMRGARTLNSVSRSLSEVGRSPSHVGGFRRLPFSRPAITRMRGPGRRVRAAASSDLDEPKLILPPFLHEAEQLGGEPSVVGEAPGFTMRLFHQVAIA